MGAVIFGLILGAGLAVFAYWIHALIHYDPEERPCDGDCESCPFPSDGCRWKKEKEDNTDEGNDF